MISLFINSEFQLLLSLFIKYLSQFKIMYYLQHLIIALSPKTIKCVEPTGQEEISFEEQNQHSPYAIITSKVPTFQSLLNPIRMICSRHEHIRGFKFDINMPLSPYFQTGHSWNIPSSGMSKNPMKPNQPTYTFNSQLVRDIQQGQPQTILTARIDNQGKLQAFFIKKLMPNLTMRINAMYMNSNIQNGMVGADFDYESIIKIIQQRTIILELSSQMEYLILLICKELVVILYLDLTLIIQHNNQCLCMVMLLNLIIIDIISSFNISHLKVQVILPIPYHQKKEQLLLPILFMKLDKIKQKQLQEQDKNIIILRQQQQSIQKVRLQLHQQQTDHLKHLIAQSYALQ